MQTETTPKQMINGVLTTLKLYLSQVIMQLLLILLVALRVLEQFPYIPAQAGVVLAFTIVIPNIFLVLWAAAGRVTAEGMLRQLIHKSVNRFLRNHRACRIIRITNRDQAGFRSNGRKHRIQIMRMIRHRHPDAFGLV